MKFLGFILFGLAAICGGLANFSWVAGVVYAFVSISNMATIAFMPIIWALLASVGVWIGVGLVFIVLTMLFGAISVALLD